MAIGFNEILTTQRRFRGAPQKAQPVVSSHLVKVGDIPGQ